jgi:hypothetical protein
MLRIAPTARSAPSARPLSRLAALALAVAIGAPGAAFAAEPDSVSLNLMPLPASRQQLDMKTDVRMTMSMEAGPDAPEKARQTAAALKDSGRFTMRSEMRQSVTTTPKAADGSYAMRADLVTLKSEMRDATGKVQPMPNMGKITFKAGLKNDEIQSIDVELDPNSPMASTWSQEVTRQMFDKAFDWMRKFNGTTLKVGESIELPMDVSLPPGVAAGNGRMVGRYTLTELKRGIATFDVGVKMDMALTVPVPPAKAASGEDAASAPTDTASAPANAASAPADRAGQAAMSGTGQGTMVLRMADRLMLRNDMTMTLDMDLGMQQGVMMRMNMQMDMQAVGKSLAAAKGAAPAKTKAKG